MSVDAGLNDDGLLLQQQLEGEQFEDLNDDGQFHANRPLSGQGWPIAGAGRQEGSESESEIEQGVGESLPDQRKPALIPDIVGGREKQAQTANLRHLTDIGTTLQGQTNTARMRGEGRYGAATGYAIGNFVARTGEGASGVSAAATLPASMAAIGAAPVKATVSKLFGAAGQTLEGIADAARDRRDPEALGEQQTLIDIANQHFTGSDSAGGGTGLTRQEEADAYGIRFEKGDHAKRLWKGRKKRSAGRIAENWLSAPVRGVGSFLASIPKGIMSAARLVTNTIPKYARKVAGWLGGKLNKKGRARAGFRNMTRFDGGHENRSTRMADPRYQEREASLTAHRARNDAVDPNDPSQKKTAWRGSGDPGAWRGTDAAIRQAVRTHQKALGHDLMLKSSEFRSLDRADQSTYLGVERTRLVNSPDYQKALESQSTGAIERVRAQMYPEKPDPQPDSNDNSDLASEQPGLLGERPAEGDAGADFEQVAADPDLPDHMPGNSSSKLMSGAKGLGTADALTEKVLKLQKNVALGVPAANVLGSQIPDLLNASPDLLEGYAPVQEGAQAVGDFLSTNVKKPMDWANSLTGVKQLPLVPLVTEGVKTTADLLQTAGQFRHRKDDPNSTGHRERQGVQDLRAMFGAQRALAQAEGEIAASKSPEEAQAGAQERQAQQQARIRRKLRTAVRLAMANSKLAKAQTAAGITARNEYSHKQEEFISTGKFAKDKTENSRIYNLFFGQRAAAAAMPEAVSEDPDIRNDAQSDGAQSDGAQSDGAQSESSMTEPPANGSQRLQPGEIDFNVSEDEEENAELLRQQQRAFRRNLGIPEGGEAPPGDGVGEMVGGELNGGAIGPQAEEANAMSEGTEIVRVPPSERSDDGAEETVIERMPMDPALFEGVQNSEDEVASNMGGRASQHGAKPMASGSLGRHSFDVQANKRPTSFTNVPDLNFDEPLDNFMYEPGMVERVQGLLEVEARKRGMDPAQAGTPHQFFKAKERLDYPDLAQTEREKRVLNDEGGRNAANPDLVKNEGPTEINGREVYPEFGAVDEPRAAFGGDWRDLETNQVIQNAGRTGDEADSYREWRDEIPALEEQPGPVVEAERKNNRLARRL